MSAEALTLSIRSNFSSFGVDTASTSRVVISMYEHHEISLTPRNHLNHYGLKRQTLIDVPVPQLFQMQIRFRSMYAYICDCTSYCHDLLAHSNVSGTLTASITVSHPVSPSPCGFFFFFFFCFGTSSTAGLTVWCAPSFSAMASWCQ